MGYDKVGLIILFLLFLLLVGCASTGAEKWCRQGSVTCQYWEYSDCERIAGNCTKEWKKETDLSMKDRRECDELLGSKRFMRKSNKDELKAFESCMKSKGYKKIEKGKMDLGVLHLKMVLFPVGLLTGVLANLK